MNQPVGFLLVDKPLEWTSFDVVAKIRGILSKEYGRRIKVGHAGTLDPMATGLLILAIGPATKQIDGLMKLNKTYDTEIILGKISTTDDQEGELTIVDEDPQFTVQELDEALISFTGEIDQVPPQFSAIKVDGQRAYKQARKGKKVELKSRRVKIRIYGVEFDLPTVKFIADVSSGTYIRSLARDIGQKLGCGAYLSSLRRLSIGDFSVQDAISMDDVNIELIRKHLKTP